MNKNIGGSLFNEYLIHDENVTYYFGYRPLKLTDKTEDIIKDFSLTKTNNLRIKYDYDNNTLHEYKATTEPKILTYENISIIDWKINNEEKIILGFKCHNASANFRGRKYNVWYTKEIPINEGPWKLKGVPGLILYAIDEDSKFEYKAKRVLINSNLSVPDLLKKYFYNEKVNAIKLSEAIPMENIFLNNLRSKVRASYPLGTKFIDNHIRSEMKEITFEWEKEESKKP